MPNKPKHSHSDRDRIWGWEMSFGLVTFGIMIGLIVSGVL